VSEPKNFLSRWSERKRHPETEKPAPGEEETSVQPAAPATGSPPTEAAEPFDPASLPSLESITANSDIRAFLQRGVPAELTRAALRRAWSADPAIRDFVGLSENAWDFNKPDSIPGFGSLSREEVKRVVTQFLGAAQETEGRAVPEASGKGEEIPAQEEAISKSDSDADTSAESEAARDVALQQDEPINPPRPTRRHGGALPE